MGTSVAEANDSPACHSHRRGRARLPRPHAPAGERAAAGTAQPRRRHRVGQDRRRLKLEEAWQDLDVIVDRGDGGLYSPPSFSKAWERFAARSGFAGVKFHGLRHGAATLMLAAGVPDAVAMRLIGHTSAKMLDRYRDVVDDLLRDAANRMESVLGGS